MLNSINRIESKPKFPHLHLFKLIKISLTKNYHSETILQKSSMISKIITKIENKES